MSTLDLIVIASANSKTLDITNGEYVRLPNNTNVTLTAIPSGGSGTYTSYLWNYPTGASTSPTNGANIILNSSNSNLWEGCYSISVTDSVPNTFKINFIVSPSPLPTVNINGFINSIFEGIISCGSNITIQNNKNLILLATLSDNVCFSNMQFQWFYEDNPVPLSNNQILQVPHISGTYNLVAYDNNLISDTCPINVKSVPQLTASAEIMAGNGETIILTCNCDAVTVNSSGTNYLIATPSGGVQPYNIQWYYRNPSSPDNSLISTSTTAQIIGTGIYTLTVSDANDTITSCYYNIQLINNDNSLLNVTFQLSNICSTQTTSCNGILKAQDINKQITTLTAFVSGGFQPYTYKWTIPANNINYTTPTIEIKQGGLYTLFVYDDSRPVFKKTCSVIVQN